MSGSEGRDPPEAFVRLMAEVGRAAILNDQQAGISRARRWPHTCLLPLVARRADASRESSPRRRPHSVPPTGRQT
jgi:hypothetical protein